MSTVTASAETAKDFGDPPQSSVGRWLAEVKAYDKTFDDWSKRADKIVRRYRNEAADSGLGSDDPNRFQILWANVETIKPALYSRMPEPSIERAFKDRDQVARASAEILERATRTESRDNGFDAVMRTAVLDYLLVGRGTGWVRYVPTYGKETRDRIELQAATDDATETVSYSTPDGEPLKDGQEPQFEDGKPYTEAGDPYRPVVAECVEFEHIAWKDFGHTPAPKWSKVRAVWRREMLTRDQMVERFGENVGNACQLTKTATNVDDQSVTDFGDVFKRAEVFEIWDRPSGKVIWISQGYSDGPLDEKDDPLGLEDFFPCPMPLYATMTTDSLVPVADYDEYRTQAEEIDRLTKRIRYLTQSLKVVGAYNGAVGDELEGLIDGDDENRLIPIENWAAFGDKGIDGNITFLPIKQVADVVVALSNIRTQLKQDLSEVTGISDIVRGQASGPAKTATEQRIKGQYAGMRIQDRQTQVARFARDLVKIAAEIIAEHFSAETLWSISGWEHSDEARALDYAMKQWEQASAPPPPQLAPPQPSQPPMPPQGGMPPGMPPGAPQGLPQGAGT